MESKKSTFWKFALGFLGLIILAIALFFAWNIYSFKKGEKAVNDLAEGLERAGEELYKLQLADTVGGKTPQETLSLYIEAVEAGDYELASKYFVIEKQEEQLENIRRLTSESKTQYLELLTDALNKNGEYETQDQKYYSFDEPILIRVGLYPSNVWKILEI